MAELGKSDRVKAGAYGNRTTGKGASFEYHETEYHRKRPLQALELNHTFIQGIFEMTVLSEHLCQLYYST